MYLKVNFIAKVNKYGFIIEKTYKKIYIKKSNSLLWIILAYIGIPYSLLNWLIRLDNYFHCNTNLVLISSIATVFVLPTLW